MARNAVSTCGRLRVITEIVSLGLVTAVVSRTVTQEQIFAWLRTRVKNTWLSYLVGCQYCFSFWIASILVVLSEPWRSFVGDFVIETLLVVAIANTAMITYELATVKI